MEDDLLLNRLRRLDESTLKWYYTSPVGSVYNSEERLYVYDPRILHSYSNAVNRRETMVARTCTVSIGFVDLAFLREAVITTESRINKSDAVTRWVGYEASPYCVAKSIVIATMLKLSAPVDAVLQVWYSTAWTSSTLNAFRKAIKHALDKREFSGANHSDVLMLLAHWLKSDVTLQEARKQWVRYNKSRWLSIANFKIAADRYAMATYSLTGQVLGGDVGSVVMFAFPNEYAGRLAHDQSMFQSIDFKKLMDVRASAPDIVAAAVDYFRKVTTW